MPRRLGALALILLTSLLAPGPAFADVTLPPTSTDVDYQLGGSSPLPKHVGIVVRDREAKPSRRAYSVCYINGFQTQPDQKAFWKRHLDLVLKKSGKPVVDAEWGEWLLDIRTPRKRARLARIVGRWTAGCAADGYEGVEFDNLDSFTRSKGLVTGRQASRYAALLVGRAHVEGLAAAQKNRAHWDGTAVGYDFAIAEECGRWKECGRYVGHYGRQVLVVEYRRKDFRRTCSRWAAKLPIVLRDRELTPGGVHDWC